MATFTFDNLKDAARAIRKDANARDRRLRYAVRKAARESRNYMIRETVPHAFSELSDSIYVEDEKGRDGIGNSRVIADAPHAEAVENGARPHWMPLEPLLHWVQLRGFQGLSPTGLIRRGKAMRSEDGESAKRVGRMLRSHLGRKGAASWREQAGLGSLATRELGADPATIAVARAIQAKIAKSGTRPRKFMQRAIGPTIGFLDSFVREALPDR